MSSLLTCPSCSRPLHVPPELAGQRVKCPACGSTFEGSAEGAPPVEEPHVPSAPSAEEERPGIPQAFPTGIQAEPAGLPPGPEEDREERDDEDEEDERPWERRRWRVRRDAEPHRGSLILVLGIVSMVFAPLAVCCGVFGIVCALAGLGLGIPAWVMGRGDLRKMDQGVMDPEGRGVTQGGMVCGIVGTALGSLMALLYLVVIGVYAGLMTWNFSAGPPATPPPVTPAPAPATQKL